MSLRDERVLIDDLMYPEGPRWHDGRFYVADFYGCEVVSADLAGSKETVVRVPQQPSGIGWNPDGAMLVVSMLDARLMSYDGAHLREVADLSDTTAHANDMVVDSRGRAYVGGMPAVYSDVTEVVDGINGTEIPDEAQNLYLVDSASGKVSIAASEVKFPNGSVITPDGRTLIVAESMAFRLIAFDIGDDGTLSNQRVWADLGFMLDGICLDAENHVWAAVPFPAELRGFYRVAEGGEIKERIETERAAMACALGGPDRDYLCMIEATILGTGAAPQLRTRGNGRARVGRVEVPGAGLP